MERDMDRETLYEIFRAKDARFDGRFFVGVSSTGVYCRPVCRARLPKARNCAFFTTAAAAEAAGYRPCLLCRPELAPGAFPPDAAASLAARAARMIESGGGDSLAALARSLGCTDRRLRRVFKAEFGVTPAQYRQTCRLLLAKNLLTGTALPVIDVAMASGFGSLRQFNEVFRAHYRLTPTAFRKRLDGGEARTGAVAVLLGYLPPYRFAELLTFFAGRAIPGVESVEDGAYLRAVRIFDARGKAVTGWLRAEDCPEKNALRVTVSDTLLPVLPQVLGRLRRMFDLGCDPAALSPVLEDMNAIRPGLYVPGVRVPGCFEPFETAVRAVLGQQITVRAASTLAGRLAEALGVPAETGLPALTRVFPSPEELLALPGPLEDRLGALGVVGARGRTIEALARAFAGGTLGPGPGADPEAAMETLLALKGVGPWTAKYIAMRALSWPDAFLETDYGVKKALPEYSGRALTERAEAWRPWRSYATVSLWNSLAKGEP